MSCEKACSALPNMTEQVPAKKNIKELLEYVRLNK
jgi:hypothetical protein